LRTPIVALVTATYELTDGVADPIARRSVLSEFAAEELLEAVQMAGFPVPVSTSHATNAKLDRLDAAFHGLQEPNSSASK
jgi:hypothetical protein